VTAQELPAEVVQFILSDINSVDQLEVLLLLREQPNKDWSPAEVSRALYTQPESAASRLADLRARGLVARTEGREPLYRYQPVNARLRSLVDRLAQAYRQRRVSVISLIYSKPLDQVQAFADAFRIR
jgi:hypothetical protein